MAELINLKTLTDKRGNLTVIEKVVPFDIKRVFYIYGVDDSVRGGHRHKKTIQAAVCIKGSCRVRSNNGMGRIDYELDAPDKFLVLNPEDWHTMDKFTEDAILMVFASEYYDVDDYIYEDYKN